jgi:hypothetical protein
VAFAAAEAARSADAITAKTPATKARFMAQHIALPAHSQT